MDIPVAVLLTIAVIWLLMQERTESGPAFVPRGVPALSATIVTSVVAVDWFAGRRGILGHPGNFLHTIFKLALVGLFISFVASGLTAIRFSPGPAKVLISVAWSGLLSAIALKFIGVW
jgi:hypothetical protein